jgi:predicted metalloprotease with PDZ domain
MYTKTVLSALFFLIGFRLATAQPLRYTVTPEYGADGRASLRVSVQFEPARDTSWFRLPVRSGWTQGRGRCFSRFEGLGGVAAFSADSARVALRAENGVQQAVLQYVVNSPNTDTCPTRANAQTPLLQAGWWYAPGSCLFLIPAHYRHFDVEVDWRLPAGWTLQSNHGRGGVQRFYCENADWRDGVWVAGGDLRFYRDTVFGRPVHFALRGAWEFDDRTIFKNILHTVRTQYALWNERDFSQYTVTMLPLCAPRDESGRAHREMLGYGQYQAFTAFIGPECTELRLLRLFNHEMMHTWIGRQIRDARDGASMDWFTEGFTDYYALRNRWKAGFLSAEAFFEEWNERFIDLHYHDTYSELSAAAQREQRYRNDRIYKMVYRRGAIAAFWIDCAIRARSNNTRTLHDFMLDLRDYCNTTGHYLHDHFGVFVQKLTPYLGEDPQYFLKEYITKGKRIKAADFCLPSFVKMRVDEDGTPRFCLDPADPQAAEKFLR